MRKKELTWEGVRKSLNFTPEEEAEIQIESQIIEAIINARKKKLYYCQKNITKNENI